MRLRIFRVLQLLATGFLVWYGLELYKAAQTEGLPEGKVWWPSEIGVELP